MVGIMAERAILSFDIGGTLLRTSHGGFCSQLCRMIGRDAEDIRPLLSKHFLTSKRTLHEAVFDFCSDSKLGNPKQIIARYRKPAIEVFEEARSVLMELRRRQYEMVAISNCTTWEATDLDQVGLSKFFSHIFHSCDTGFSKPDPRAFRVVEEILSAPSKVFTHIGDSLISDIVGARSCGWKTVIVSRSSSVAGSFELGETLIAKSLADLLYLFGPK
jgi:FMN phosphatase YigB (HAD superfamily)